MKMSADFTAEQMCELTHGAARRGGAGHWDASLCSEYGLTAV